MRYIVTLEATRTIEVEAEDESEANDKASDIANREVPEVYWTPVDCDNADELEQMLRAEGRDQ